MDEINLALVCLNAFVAVMGLLSLLALAVRGMNALFPVTKATTDAAILAAIHTAVQQVVPGGRVTRIEPHSKG